MRTVDIQWRLHFNDDFVNEIERNGMEWNETKRNGTLTAGEPIDFSDLVARCQKCRDDKQREDLFRSMVARVEESMRETRVRNLKEREVL